MPKCKVSWMTVYFFCVYKEIEDGRKNFLRKVASTLWRYSVGRKFHRNHSVLHCYQDKCVFYAFYTENQDGRPKKQEGQRCPKMRVAQAAIRSATAVITSRNKERNARLPS